MEPNTLIYTLNEFIVIYRKILRDYTHYIYNFYINRVESHTGTYFRVESHAGTYFRVESHTGTYFRVESHTVHISLLLITSVVLIYFS